MKEEKMNCSRIRNMISPYVDDELTPDEMRLFASHVQDCPACGKALEEVQSVHRLLASAEKFEAPDGFTTRLMAHLEEAEKTSLSQPWRFITGRSFFLHAVEVAFAIIIMLVGVVSGNLLIAGRQPVKQTSVEEAFSLDLFNATPPDSIGGVFARLAGVADEK